MYNYPSQKLSSVKTLTTTQQMPSPPSVTLVLRKTQPQQLECPLCGMPTQTVCVKKKGKVVWLWCCVLVFVGFCCMPFLASSCHDTHLICARCVNTKSVIKGNCF